MKSRRNNTAAAFSTSSDQCQHVLPPQTDTFPDEIDGKTMLTAGGRTTPPPSLSTAIRQLDNRTSCGGYLLYSCLTDTNIMGVTHYYSFLNVSGQYVQLVFFLPVVQVHIHHCRPVHGLSTQPAKCFYIFTVFLIHEVRRPSVCSRLQLWALVMRHNSPSVSMLTAANYQIPLNMKYN